VITVPNEKLLGLAPKGTSFLQAFKLADDVLRQAVQGISDIITTPGLINRDFSDIRTIMVGMGYAMMGTATATGPNAARDAAEQAINSPLMDEGGVHGARGVLINITGSSNLGIHEVNEACNLIREATHNNDVQINFGIVIDEKLGDEVKITVIATGFQRETSADLERKNPHFPFSVTTSPEMPGGAAEPVAAAPEPEPVGVAATLEAPVPEDEDMPAYLRKQRRSMVQ
jgi:cell division protein FtsZ